MEHIATNPSELAHLRPADPVPASAGMAIASGDSAVPGSSTAPGSSPATRGNATSAHTAVGAQRIATGGPIANESRPHAEEDAEAPSLQETLQRLAPGTALRDALGRIQRGRTGALIVFGNGPEVAALSDGGIEFDVPFKPTMLRELAKMDGAVVLNNDGSRIQRANVQLVPAQHFPTQESGTRHRSAERTALQTGCPVIAVSASMNVITLYVNGERHILEEPAEILARANQALATMERYRLRLDNATQALNASEVHEYTTVSAVAGVLRREILLLRVAQELDQNVLELGTEGRHVRLQLTELRGSNEEEIEFLLRDYVFADGIPTDEDISAAQERLSALTDRELLTPAFIAQALRLPSTDEALNQVITPRGYRVLARIPRVQRFQMHRIIGVFGTLKALLAAPEEELAAIDGVGPLWAHHIHDGLSRQTLS